MVVPYDVWRVDVLQSCPLHHEGLQGRSHDLIIGPRHAGI